MLKKSNDCQVPEMHEKFGPWVMNTPDEVSALNRYALAYLADHDNRGL